MSILNTALSGLRTAQTLIDTTGNNIANANTPGYVRQRADVSTIGTAGYQLGAQISRIRRDVPNELQNQVRQDNAMASASSIFSVGASRIDLILGDSENGLNATMNSFFSSAQTLTQDPSSIPQRQTFLAQANSVASRINQMGDQLNREEVYVRQQMAVGAEQINQLASQLVDLNRRISDERNTLNPPLQLMDQRDQVLSELSSLAGADVFDLKEDQVAVYIGGNVLVSGTQRLDVEISASSQDPTRSQLVMTSNGKTVGYVANSALGGELGGTNRILDEVVVPARNELGRISLALAEAVNQTLGRGLDLNGEFGAPLFSDINSSGYKSGRAMANTANTGSGLIDVAITDTQLLKAQDYQMKFSAGGSYEILDGAGASVASGTLSGASTTIAFDGIELTLGNAADYADGDRFGLQPTRRAADSLRVALSDPAALGLAGPVVGESGLDNTGSGTMTVGAAFDVSSTSLFTTSPAGMSPELRVEFTSASTYEVRNAATNASLWSATYTPGSTIDLFAQAPGTQYTGFMATIDGLPAVGDTFELVFNAGGTSDNRGAQALSDLQETGWLNGGEERFIDSFGGLVSRTGSTAAMGQIAADADAAVYSASSTRLGDISGVNLDEEAANLVRYQQYYQASAQVVSVANELFDTLLGSLR